MAASPHSVHSMDRPELSRRMRLRFLVSSPFFFVKVCKQMRSSHASRQLQAAVQNKPTQTL